MRGLEWYCNHEWGPAVMIVVLDWLQYFVESVGHVVANRWLVFPTILASLVGMVAVAYVLAQWERD